jgi:SnoaL-like domain
MSAENVALHRRYTDAFNAWDLEAIIALCDPEVEFHSAFSMVGGASYRGHDGLRAWRRDLLDAWGRELGAEPEAYFDLGEQTLMFHVLHGRGLHSGAQVAMPNAQLIRWRRGAAVYVRLYAHREDALGDLGLDLQNLVPIAP